jgi:hypothetical protein
VALRHAAETSRALKSVRASGNDPDPAVWKTAVPPITPHSQGAGFGSRTRLAHHTKMRPVPRQPAGWWSHWVTLPVVLLARQNSSLLRLTPWRAWKDSNLRRRIWNPFRNLCSDPQRLVGKSNPSPPLDRRVSTPADSRGTERSRRESNAQLLLRRQRGRAAGESLGDVRVSIPSKMHSQCTGFASSLTSQSERWESNPPVVLIPNQVALLEPALRWWFRSESNRRLSLFRRALSPGQLPNRE